MNFTSDDSDSVNAESVQSAAGPKRKRIKNFCSRWLKEFWLANTRWK